jgi:hypothetical protein
LTYLLWRAFKDDEQHIFGVFVISHLTSFVSLFEEEKDE